MARRQYTVVFTCDSAKLGDALAELKFVGVENLGFDLLRSKEEPQLLHAPGKKPSRSAVVMKPRENGPKKEGAYNGARRARILDNGKNASQTVMDYVRSCGEVGADPTDIAVHLKSQGYDKGKGPHAIAPTLVYTGQLTVDKSGPSGRSRYRINPNYVPKRVGNRPVSVRPPHEFNPTQSSNATEGKD